MALKAASNVMNRVDFDGPRGEDIRTDLRHEHTVKAAQDP